MKEENWEQLVGCIAEFKQDGLLYIVPNAKAYRLNSTGERLTYMVSYIEKNCIYITPNGLMTAVVEKKNCRVLDSGSPTLPIKHEIVCPKCQGIKIKNRGGFRNYRKEIKKAGGQI